MNIVRSIVDELNLREKKYQHEENRRKIEDVEILMSDMAKDNVALYIDYVSWINFFKKYFWNLTKEQQKFAKEEMERLKEKISILKGDPNVIEYLRMQKELSRLRTIEDEYYKTIHSDFRRELIESVGQRLPEIYVDQGDYATHIVVPGTMQTIDYPEQVNVLIAPNIADESDDKRIDSVRKARKFYNQVSFRYLMQLSEDYDFGLEGKDLGKVKIYRR